MTMSITPAGKYRLARDYSFQMWLSYKVCADITEQEKGSVSLRKIRKDLEKLKESAKGVMGKLRSLLPNLMESSQIEALLKGFEGVYSAVEAVSEEINNISGSSEKSIYKELIPLLQDISAHSKKTLDLIEARLAEIIHRKLSEEAVRLEERDKDKIAEPDKEAWEELRKQGEEAQYFTWKVIESLE